VQRVVDVELANCQEQDYRLPRWIGRYSNPSLKLLAKKKSNLPLQHEYAYPNPIKHATLVIHDMPVHMYLKEHANSLKHW